MDLATGPRRALAAQRDVLAREKVARMSCMVSRLSRTRWENGKSRVRGVRAVGGGDGQRRLIVELLMCSSWLGLVEHILENFGKQLT